MVFNKSHYSLDELKNYYVISFEFKKDFGEHFFNQLLFNFPNEINEREEINQIILNPNLEIGEKIEKILIIQSFSKNYKWFHLKYEELLPILITFNNDLPPTKSEFSRINRLLDLIYFIKGDLISSTGVLELYPEFNFLSKEIIGNPLDYYIKSEKYYKLSEMAQSSDIKKTINGLKKISLKSFLKKCEKITYLEFQLKRKSFEFFHKNKYKQQLDLFEKTNKFKIDSELFNKLKKLREINILSKDSFNSEDLLDLKMCLSPIYWEKINMFFWKGLKRELFLIKRIKSKERKEKRIDVLLYRYPKIHNRLLIYINKNV